MIDNSIENLYINCTLCPRNCGANRTASSESALGYCNSSNALKAARAGLHFYEEPFLSGENGSGTVFFTACSLGCIYCQNNSISQEGLGFEISVERLAEIFIEQKERGAHNINLVTGTHFTPSIAEALKLARNSSLSIPVVWNSSGYEKEETLSLLEGLVDIWLPDFKTLSPELGLKYMNAPDYPINAKAALSKMVSMSQPVAFEPLNERNGYEGENVLMKSGVVVRHMVIPGQIEDSKNVLRYLFETYGDKIWISLMSQYTPIGAFSEKRPYNKESQSLFQRYPELFTTLPMEEYDELVDFAIEIGIENCMIQEGETASDSFIPVFDGSGIIK